MASRKNSPPGNTALPERELLAELLTKERPWYFPWQNRPVFDPITFVTDLERLQRFCEAQGYYRCRVSYDLQVHTPKTLVLVHIQVGENPLFTVAQVRVETPGYTQNPTDSSSGAPPPP